jgi:putative hydrolase of the HAD superfamily
MYVISFISALLVKEYSRGLFLASVFSTIVIPIMIWWFITVYNWVHRDDIPKDMNETVNSEENK